MHASPTKADPTPVEVYTSPPATTTGPAAAPYVVSAPTPALSPAVLSTNQVVQDVQVAPPVHQQQVRAITFSTCCAYTGRNRIMSKLVIDPRVI